MGPGSGICLILLCKRSMIKHFLWLVATQRVCRRWRDVPAQSASAGRVVCTTFAYYDNPLVRDTLASTQHIAELLSLLLFFLLIVFFQPPTAAPEVFPN